MSKKIYPGNVFKYYVPQSAASVTVPVRDPVSLSFKQPQKFIDTNFQVALAVPFGKKSKPESPIVFNEIHLITAAMECGYGPKDSWTSHFTINATDAAELEQFLIRRAELAMRCIVQDKDSAWTVRSFWKHLESSDKTPHSFVLGGAFTYLAAGYWLSCGGDALRLCLHKTIYSKASVSVLSDGSKSPDYLVESVSGDWHLFESKGTGISSRPTKILEGLEQLEGPFKIGWKNSPKKSAVSSVCVHTRIDANKKLEILAVDPPEMPANFDSGPSQSIPLIEGVCKLLLVVRAINQFRALGAVADYETGSPGEWLAVRASAFGGLEVGIPALYLRYERSIRARIGIYLAADEVAIQYREGGPSFRTLLVRKLRAVKFDEPDKSGDFLAWTKKQHDRTVEVICALFSDGQGAFRERCANRLRLNKFARRIWATRRDKTIPVLKWGPGRFTSGGLYISR